MILACVIGAVLILASLAGPQVIAAVRKSAEAKPTPSRVTNDEAKAIVAEAVATSVRPDANITIAATFLKVLNARDELENAGMPRDAILNHIEDLAKTLTRRAEAVKGAA